ncbi:MAG: phosphotransferase family protein [Magnetovibrio sp.]|nr:phosphotransferase family protein [Magnetovibrio sp.]|tara:strand:- start:237 stop:1298 length:1062 start_codon:yes stop_codon:yes gene_type:complete
MTTFISDELHAAPMKDTLRINESNLNKYLVSKIKGFSRHMEVRQFPDGQSNPTYLISAEGKKYVLRKKPPGDLLPSAHAIDREYRIMSALKNSDVPVPTTFLFCDDTSIIGTEFFLMEMIKGRVFHDPGLPTLSPKNRAIFFEDFIRILATLHSLDFKSMGLSDFGRPEGYIERQVKRWSKQYEASKTEDIATMSKLIEWLPLNLPTDHSISIVHGDYRPGNTIALTIEPRINAVLDWELSTLGHPLADLGYCCANYHGQVSTTGEFASLNHKELGIPTEDEFLERYCYHARRDNVEDYYFYIAFSLFRSAAIIQGVYKRGLDGNASSKKALDFGGVARERSDVAWALVEKYY